MTRPKPDYNGRTKEGRRYTEIVPELRSRITGDASTNTLLSVEQEQILKRIAGLSIVIDVADAKLTNGEEIDLVAYNVTVGHLSRYIDKLEDIYTNALLNKLDEARTSDNTPQIDQSTGEPLPLGQPQAVPSFFINLRPREIALLKEYTGERLYPEDRERIGYAEQRHRGVISREISEISITSGHQPTAETSSIMEDAISCFDPETLAALDKVFG